MKRIIIALAVLLSSLAGTAQVTTFEEGDQVINVGIGFGTALYSGGAYTTGLPPLSVSYEVGIEQDIIDEGYLGVGGYFGIATAKYRASYIFGPGDYGWNYTYAVVGARGAYHYPFVEYLDTYGGAMIGINFISFKEVGDVPGNLDAASGAELTGSLYIGGRYYFSENIAAMMELGWGVSYINLGLAFKL